jgi:hypothetical protein
MRRAAMLAVESKRSQPARPATRVSRPPPPPPPSWDEELTELNLQLSDALLALAPPVAVVRVEDVPQGDDDDDLPMLDGSEFVAALSLEDLQPRPQVNAKVRRTAKAKPTPARRGTRQYGWSWLYAIAPWAAIIVIAWAFRVEIVRSLGLI